MKWGRAKPPPFFTVYNNYPDDIPVKRVKRNTKRHETKNNIPFSHFMSCFFQCIFSVYSGLQIGLARQFRRKFA